jgi:hypothetical protein
VTGRGRREFWPEGFQPHDPRGIAGHAWYAGAEDLDLAALPPEELRRLLGEAIDHVRQLLDGSDEADRYENAHEQDGTHVTTDGTAAVIRGEDLGTVREALEGAAMWATETAGSLQQVARYQAIARALDAEQ